MASLEGIEASALLGKYRVVERLENGERAVFHAKVDGSDTDVCLLELGPDEVTVLSRALKVEHAHLARVLEVVTHEGVPLLVFERVPGTTLTARLAEVQKKTQQEAVGAALRVSDALSHLHEAGAVHGFLHTDSVLLDPPERLGPVLTFAPIPSDERTFHSPERGETGKPSVADDAWAVSGLLHMMLTGKPPPKDGYASDEELVQAGVEDPALRAALLHGLHADEDARSHDVRPLKRELARWFVEHAAEEPVLLGPHSTHPPPLPGPGPESISPASVVSRGMLGARRRKPRFALVAIGGTLAGLLAAWGYSHYRSRPEVRLIERAPVAAAIAPAKAIDLSEVPVTGEGQNVELDNRASCVAGYLPKGAFAKSPELEWLCTETDAQKGAQKLRVAIVTAAPKASNPTGAMKIFSRLGWYDMAAYAVVRAGCCDEPNPLTLADPSPGCDPMADALRELGKGAVEGKSYEEPLKRFSNAIQCEVNLGRGQTFGRAQKPAAGEDSAFKELVDAIQR